MGPLEGIRDTRSEHGGVGTVLHHDARRSRRGRNQDRTARRRRVAHVTGLERSGVTVGILNWNRNKRAMMLDLKRRAPPKCFSRWRSTRTSSMQNVRPGVVDRLGVGYDAVAARNPKIVYCSIAGYGFSGPSVNKPAYDPIIQGMAGVMTSQRTQGRPRAVKNILGDKVTAMTAAISILAALHRGAAQRQGTASADRDDRRRRLLPDARHGVAPHLSAARRRRRRRR